MGKNKQINPENNTDNTPKYKQRTREKAEERKDQSHEIQKQGRRCTEIGVEIKDLNFKNEQPQKKRHEGEKKRGI